MLSTNLIHEVDLLSVKERLALMEYLAHSVQKELEQEPLPKKHETKAELRLLTTEEKQALQARIREELGEYRARETATAEKRGERLTPLTAWHGQKLERGALKELSQLTDEDVEDIIFLK